MQKLYISVVLLTATATLANAQTVRPMMPLDNERANVLRVHHETDAAAAGPAKILSTLGSEESTVADWSKQSVYDLSDKKIGDIVDVLLDHEGKATAIIIGVGGFLGIGEKDVAVGFDSVHFKNKDDKWQLVMNTTKDALQSAQGYRFDRTTRKWMPEAAGTIGSGGGPPPIRR